MTSIERSFTISDGMFQDKMLELMRQLRMVPYSHEVYSFRAARFEGNVPGWTITVKSGTGKTQLDFREKEVTQVIHDG